LWNARSVVDRGVGVCDVGKEKSRFSVFFEVCALKKMELRLGVGGGVVGMRRGIKVVAVSKGVEKRW
jgi:hypothetical protein